MPFLPPNQQRQSTEGTKWVSQLLKNLNFKNLTWRTATILKTVKSPYLCKRLTDFDEIWHADAYWPPTADGS